MESRLSTIGGPRGGGTRGGGARGGGAREEEEEEEAEAEEEDSGEDDSANTSPAAAEATGALYNPVVSTNNMGSNVPSRIIRCFRSVAIDLALIGLTPPAPRGPVLLTGIRASSRMLNTDSLFATSM
jgi:hypothetical protein